MVPRHHQSPPKSSVPLGIRVNFEGNPNKFQEAAKAIVTAYLKMVFLHQSPLNDFFDLGFLCKEDADQAAEEIFTLEVTDPKGKNTQIVLPTICTRFNQETILFISFGALPLDIPGEEVESQLKEGLSKYGETSAYWSAECQKQINHPHCSLLVSFWTVCLNMTPSLFLGMCFLKDLFINAKKNKYCKFRT
ncbi:hypothetical protein DSO57_1018258 [Entomophthora muscae]|uniref:Uncharacterized protein n=1 Tax=Entomophthora muscae TaxID=34485 RepID=A0ACC2U267_9FUNG|nr:hypothetical protein DSO57_1018258 [Entomophthora muscae]